MCIYMKLRKMSWLEPAETGYVTEAVLKKPTADKWEPACKTALCFPACPLPGLSVYCTVEELGLRSALRSDLICPDISEILTTIANGGK